MPGKKERTRNRKKYKVRVIAGILTFVLVFVSINLIEFYHSTHYRKNMTTGLLQKNTTIPVESDIGKVKQFELSIPKLGMSVNVVPNVDGGSDDIYNEALKSGVAHYKNTALPGSGSNILIFGHSSGVWGAGSYTKIFSKLNNLVNGDEIVLKYNYKNYKYLVSNKKIIKATDLSPTEPTEREQLTLMTCWPIGTDSQRLTVIAKPDQAKSEDTPFNF